MRCSGPVTNSGIGNIPVDCFPESQSLDQLQYTWH